MSKRHKPLLNDVQCSPPKKNKAGPRIAPNGYRLPDPLPAGELLTDNTKNTWLIGQSIGCGGFGEIYAAKPSSERNDLWNFVVKVDHLNGPLYAEMYFYHRVAKEDYIRNWMREKRLDFLGMPRYIASGIHEKASKNAKPVKGKSASAGTASSGAKYRFLVMQRFGDDLQKKLEEVNHTFEVKTTFTIAKKVIDILEYIHSFGYIHADIKASNLLLGRSYAPTPKGKGLAEQNGIHSEIWLVDFGLVEKFRNNEGEHKTCEEDQRRANNGTVEFTSRDSHVGALCRRSDLEILGFNMLSWLSGGRLPWMSNLKDHKFVHSCKKYYMARLHELFNYAFNKDATCNDIEYESAPPVKGNAFEKSKLKANVPPGIIEYFQYIVKLDFTQDPDYELLKAILSNAIAKVKGVDFDDGRFFFNKIHPKTVAKIASRLKRSSLSSPEMGRRRRRVSDNESCEESPEENGTPVRKLPVRGRKKETVEKRQDNRKNVADAAVRLKVPKNVRSKSVSPTKSPCLSAPTSHATPLKTPESGHLSAGLDKPTPAMLELMQRLKEKRQKSGFPHPGKLFAKEEIPKPAITVTNAVKRGRSNAKSQTNGSASSNSVSSPALASSPVKKRGKSQSKTRVAIETSGDSKKLSSNSSTHSTKENKAQPTRRSPRVHV